MPGPPNVNPFARSYSESIRPYVDKALENARPELTELADIYINKLPWLKRKVAAMVWWPILQIITNRIIDAIIETFLSVRGEIRASDCSPSVRAAFASSAMPGRAAIAGSPHWTADYRPGNPDPAEIDENLKRHPKVIKTIDRGKEYYWANTCKNRWIPSSERAAAKEFPCYEVAFSYFQEIPAVDRVGDPKIVNKDF